MEREELLSLPITLSFTIVISYRYSKSPLDHYIYNLKIDPLIEHVQIETCNFLPYRAQRIGAAKSLIVL